MSQQVSPSQRGCAPRRGQWVVFAVLAVLGFVADYVTKEWALSALAPRQTPPTFLGGWLSFPVVFNPGAAFSFGESATVAFTVLAIAAIVVICYYGLVKKLSWLEVMIAGLLAAGVGGNLADRLLRPPGVLRGYVVDFISVKHFAVFNVADIWITTAAIGLIIMVVVDYLRERREQTA